jgi:hypothetical protein
VPIEADKEAFRKYFRKRRNRGRETEKESGCGE